MAVADNSKPNSPWNVRNVVGAGEAAFVGGKNLVEFSGREVTAFGDPALGKLGAKAAAKAFVAVDWHFDDSALN